MRTRYHKGLTIIISMLIGILIGMYLYELGHEDCIEASLLEQTSTEPIVETIYNVETIYETVSYLGEFKITAYCACEKCCGIYASGYTATGTYATEGRTIAVDPSVIPYGTTVKINGQNYVAEDCGGAIKGNRIDIFFDSHDEASKYGVQNHDVFLVN